MLGNLRRLQTQLYAALRAFMGGSLARLSVRTSTRSAAACHPEWTQRLHDISALSRHINVGGRTDDAPPASTVGEAARVLAIGYRVLRQNLPDDAARPEADGALPVLRDMRDLPGDAPGHAAMSGLKEYLGRHCGEELRAAYVHGSYSTGDITAYSDLDTLLILRAPVVEDAEWLLDCARRVAPSNRYLLHCDLLQHHTHFVLTETDFLWYPDAFFPRVLYGYSTRLLGEGTLAVRTTRDSSEECREALGATCARFVELQSPGRLRLAYYFKLHLSCFLILPALLSQSLGASCYKRDSFERVRPHYDAETWSVMDEVSDIRRQWRQTSPRAWARILGLHPALPAVLFRRYGTWGVPSRIFQRATAPAFLSRQRHFAEQTLAIAERHAPGGSTH